MGRHLWRGLQLRDGESDLLHPTAKKPSNAAIDGIACSPRRHFMQTFVLNLIHATEEMYEKCAVPRGHKDPRLMALIRHSTCA